MFCVHLFCLKPTVGVLSNGIIFYLSEEIAKVVRQWHSLSVWGGGGGGQTKPNGVFSLAKSYCHFSPITESNP